MTTTIWHCRTCNKNFTGFAAWKSSEDGPYCMGCAGLEAEAMKRAIAVLAELLDIHNKCDQERLQEMDEAYTEAALWEREGDHYGKNFHQGRASGMTQASIIFDRVRRALTPGDKTYPKTK